MKCKHKWKLIDKTIIESAVTKLINEGREIDISGPPSAYADRLVYVFQCEACSKIKIGER